MAKGKKVKIHTDVEATGKEDTVDDKKDLNEGDTLESVDPLKEMEEKVESLKKEAAENHDRLLRVAAEFENYKKRAAREMNDFRKFANESFVKAMLPVVDSLDLAIESSSTDTHTNHSVVEGVSMTLKEILKVFEQFGVKRFESMGNVFDPSLHQAVMQEETQVHPDNTVLRELQKGYMIHDRLLRPAMVVVSKKTAKPEKRENSTQKKENE
ncbi:MAG: nucleotide exchange factor GrpE [Deltaproteobacteria bacterium]|jgi:molecular chaperone GrpE|nr:nucleotide exchange factor GrpE [Deltaproteobacteria bacterium]